MLFNNIIYGPIKSRRLGTSLGVELMPLDHKLCTFNCVYCECGWNEPVSHPQLPTREQVREALEKKLKEGLQLDVITFSGNGEPTLHPDFLGIIEDTITLRNQYCPNIEGNKVAKHIYESFGFEPNGDNYEDEITLVLKVK